MVLLSYGSMLLIMFVFVYVCMLYVCMYVCILFPAIHGYKYYSYESNFYFMFL